MLLSQLSHAQAWSLGSRRHCLVYHVASCLLQECDPPEQTLFPTPTPLQTPDPRHLSHGGPWRLLCAWLSCSSSCRAGHFTRAVVGRGRAVLALFLHPSQCPGRAVRVPPSEPASRRLHGLHSPHRTTRGHRDNSCLAEGTGERSMPFPAALVRAVKESRALLGSIPARRHHVSLTVFTLALALARGSPARSNLAPD